jgi:hypothetical protein
MVPQTRSGSSVALQKISISSQQLQYPHQPHDRAAAFVARLRAYFAHTASSAEKTPHGRLQAHH